MSYNLCVYYYFPLWQGSGSTKEILSAAGLFKEKLSNIPLNIVDGFSLEGSDTKNNIQNYDVLVHNLQSFAKKLEMDKPDKVFTLGGDCSLEVIPVGYLYKKYKGNLTVLWLDAHADINTPETSPSKTLHGMPVRVLLGEGDPAVVELGFRRLKPEDLVYLGTRDLDLPEVEYVKSQKMRTIGVDEVLRGMGSLGGILKENVYVHIDLDVLNPEEFASVMCPSLGGISKEALLSLVQKVSQTRNIVGGSVLECAGEKEEDIDYAAGLFSLFV